MPVSQGVWSYVTQSEIPVLNEVKGRIECIAPGKGNHGPVKVDGTYNFKYADGTRYYPVGTTSYDWMHVAGNQPDQTVKSLELSKFNKIRMLFLCKTLIRIILNPPCFLLR